MLPRAVHQEWYSLCGSEGSVSFGMVSEYLSRWWGHSGNSGSVGSVHMAVVIQCLTVRLCGSPGGGATVVAWEGVPSRRVELYLSLHGAVQQPR